MPYKIEWFQPASVVLVKVTGTAEIQDAENINQELLDYLDNASNMLHVLLDFTELASVPLHIHKASAAQAYMKHPRMGWLLVYGTDNGFLKMLGAIVTQLWRVRSRIFSTQAEALAFLEENVLDSAITPPVGTN
jgi:hypothetical protein